MRTLLALLLLCSPALAQSGTWVFPPDVYTQSGEATIDIGYDVSFTDPPNWQICQLAPPYACSGWHVNYDIPDGIATMIPQAGIQAMLRNGGAGPDLVLIRDPITGPNEAPGDLWNYWACFYDFSQPIDQLPLAPGFYPDEAVYDVFFSKPGWFDLEHPNVTYSWPLSGGVTFISIPVFGFYHNTPVAGCDTAWVNGEGNKTRIAWRTFVRGDANGDGATTLTIADVLFLNDYLFNGGAEPPCHMAADANDDDTLGLADSIFILDYLFNAGLQPPAPFPSCDVDPADTGINPPLSCIAGCIPQ